METDYQIGSWTAQQISDYVHGRMANADAHRMERDMLEDPFLSDAVEGNSSVGVGPDMDSLERKWKVKSDAKSGGNNVLSSVAIGIVVLAVIGMGVMFFQQREVQDMALEVGEAMEETRALEQVYADSLEVMEIQLAHVIVAEKEIRPEETRQAQAAIKEIQEAESQHENQVRLEAPDALKPLSYSNEVAQDELEVKEPAPKLFYLHDLKMADHRAEYEDERYIQGEWMSGTAAKYERERNGTAQIPDIVQLDYEGILSEAMTYFAQRDYKSALLVLKRVEKRHLNDANVAFYGGLCYYNLSKWSKADIRFRRALDHPSRVFDQEARWYLALSLIDQKKIERARYHLRSIIDKDEFYASRAKELLRQID